MDRSKFKDFIASFPFPGKIRFFFEHPEWVAFIIIFGTMLRLNLYRNDYEFYGDAIGYWLQARAFQDPATRVISLLNFSSALRGYLLPLMLYVIIILSSFLRIPDKFLLEIIQSFVFSGLIAIIIPYVLKKLFKSELRFWQILLFGLLVIFFWQGYLYYPLSDFWALSFFIFGLYLFLYHGDYKWALFLTGTFFGGATIIRPSYSITLVFLLLWSAYYFYKHQNQTKKQIFVNEIIIVIGLALVLLPQLLININRYGVISPLPLTQIRGGKNLFIQQLTWGIQIQNATGVLSPKHKRPLAGAYYMDPHGRNILIQSGFDPNAFFSPTPNGPGTNVLTLSEYALMVRKHPLDFLTIYVRHLFNGLDVVYNAPYISDINENTSHRRLLNYSLWFLSVLYISKRIKYSDALSYQFPLFLILVLPSILSIPTAMEVRFMLPFYFTSYSIAAFFALPMFFSLTGKQKINVLLKYMPWYGAFVMTCFLLSINAFTDIMHREVHILYIFW